MSNYPNRSFNQPPVGPPPLPAPGSPVAVPYATPAGYQAPFPNNIWSDGDLLLVTRDVHLPDRCVKCNAAANGYRIRKTIQWHEPWIWATILAGVLAYAIIAMILRKTVKIEFGLCPEHRRKRDMWKWIVGGLCALGVGSFVGAGFLFQQRSTEDFGFLAIAAGIIILLVAAVVGSVSMRVLKPTKIDDFYGWFKGCSPGFLSALPRAR